MFVDDIKNDILINELQLGEKLNECIHKQERSQFSLLLAMLADDVQSQGQFILPRTEQTIIESDKKSLRGLFKLPKEQALSIDDMGEVKDYNQAALIQGGSISTLRLLNVLKPMPLAFRDDIKHIPQTVLHNTSLHCQAKYSVRDIKDRNIERLNFKAQEWLNTVNESINRFSETTN